MAQMIRASRQFRRRMRRYVVVHTEDGSYAGILAAEDGHVVVLVQAELRQSGQDAVALDGECIVPLAKVSFVQVVDRP
jgi:hypothetical protein